MATWDSFSDSRLVADVYAPLPGRSPSLGIPFRQSVQPFEAELGDEGSAIVDVPKAATKTIETVQSASDLRLAGPSRDWLERVHVLPRSKIDFGNIITQVEEEYEVYNAKRRDAVALVDVQNNAAPGVELPNLAVPTTIQPQASILDPASTGNSGGVGLGTLVKLKVRATADGLPRFDTTIDFSFSDGDVLALLVAGARIIFLSPEHELPTGEILSFLTDVIDAVGGGEQRLSLRKQPRQIFRVDYLLAEAERRRMQVVLMDWMDNLFGFPVFLDRLALTAGVSAGATAYPVMGADEVDLRVGGLAVVVSGADTFDVITIDSLSATLITATNPSVNAYPAGTTIMPLRIGRLKSAVTVQRQDSSADEVAGEVAALETFRVEVEVADNDTGSLVGSTAGWSSYLGKVLLDDCNVVDASGMGGALHRRVHRLDSQTGLVVQASNWDRNKRVGAKGFVARSRAEIMKLRRLVLALRGRQKSFWIPTFADDLRVVADLAMGAATMDVANVEYARFAQSREPRRTFRITFTDATSLVRVVQSAVKVSATVERLTLDTTWPANRAVAEVARVQHYELVRFDSDDLEIAHHRVGHATLVAPVRQVRDP